jgi:hypothetical protein
MLPNSESPLPQPSAQRLDETLPLPCVALDGVPLVFGWAALLVENLERDQQIAYVVQQRCPTQLFGVVFGESNLVDDQVGVRPHSLAVATGQPVMM